MPTNYASTPDDVEASPSISLFESQLSSTGRCPPQPNPSIRLLLATAAFVALAGCSRAKPVVFNPDFHETIVPFYQLQVPKDDINFALTELSQGSLFFNYGDQLDSDPRFAAALDVMDQIKGDSSRETGAVVVSEGFRVYRGEPYERATAYLYRGIGLFNRGHYEAALAAFRNVLERDKETRTDDPKLREDYHLAQFFAALAYERLGEHDNAIETLRIAGGDSANSLYSEETLSKDFVALIETGSGPFLVQGPFWTKVYNSGPSPEARVEVLVDGASCGDATESTDLFVQANSQNFGKADTAAVTRGVVKFIVNLFVSVFAGRDAGIRENRDLRAWTGLPKKYFVFAADLPPGLHSVAFKFYDEKGVRLERYDQFWYEVPVTARNGMILRARSFPNAQNMYGLEAYPLAEALAKQRKALELDEREK